MLGAREIHQGDAALEVAAVDEDATEPGRIHGAAGGDLGPGEGWDDTSMVDGDWGGDFWWEFLVGDVASMDQLIFW